MTEKEKQQLTDLHSHIGSITTQVEALVKASEEDRKERRELVAKVGSLDSRMAAVGATLNAMDGRSKDEIKALFESRNGHADRIGQIEQNYVRQDAFNRHQDQTGHELRNLRESNSKLERSNARTLGGFAVLAAVLSIIGQFVVRIFIH